MKPRIFKHAPRIGLFLLLGAIINVAVAIGTAYFGIPATTESEYAFNKLADDSILHVSRTETRCTTTILISRLASSPQNSSYSQNFHGTPEELIPAWSHACETTEQFRNASQRFPSERVYEELLVVGIGWPCRSLWSLQGQQITRGNNGTLVYSDGVLTPRVAFELDYDRLTRTRLIWHGFALNTLFWTAMLWMIVILNPHLHRKLRIKRGLCPACAYPIRGGTSGVCTECGRPTPTKR